MFVQWFIVILFVAEGNAKCVKNKIKLWSPTKCEAGRRFFARLNNIPDFSGEKIAQPYLSPWLVELKIAAPHDAKSCTGALINDRYVLTAQQCILPPVQAHHVTVHVGFYNGYKNDISELFQPRLLKRAVLQLILHPSYDPTNPNTVANNLGLVKVLTPVKYSKTIFPVQLPSPGDKFKNYGNKAAEYVGWSFVSNYGNPPDRKLKQVDVKILDEEQCSNFNTNYKGVVTSGVICSVKAANSSEPCGDETGGLLTIEKPRNLYNITVLVGISVWESPVAKRCQLSAPPKVYARIDNQLGWIKENTRDGLYCRY